ncbi:hypothetical protein TNCT_241391 [Trichonephila clavata]|uniref:Uncharacterized protein n=1 Tax=Trichonephila clavata TaxID=2740835 RepID=A0A8X6H3L8_TRICU|nr:hypothetical protein TNCT_241391 [Trichonephila clavata]
MGIANMATSYGLGYIFDTIYLDKWTTMKFLLKYGFCGMLFTYGVTSLAEALSVSYSYLILHNAERPPTPTNFPAEALSVSYSYLILHNAERPPTPTNFPAEAPVNSSDESAQEAWPL